MECHNATFRCSQGLRYLTATRLCWVSATKEWLLQPTVDTLPSSTVREGATNSGVSPPSRIVFVPPRRACHLRSTSHLCLSLLRVLMTVCIRCSF